MPYLDRVDRDEMMTRKRHRRPKLSVFSFADQSDRTLTLGRNDDGAVIHVYIKNHLLYAHKYFEQETGEFITVVCFVGLIDPLILQPDVYAIPRATDCLFAETMITESLPLKFLEWDAKENQIQDSDSGYFGHIWSDFGDLVTD
jgi:hypothetical protein